LADIIIYVTARPILSNGVLAFASFCVSDEVTHRPLAGHLNYSPASLTVGSKLESQIGTTLHEISHSLGFSGQKFDEFYERRQLRSTPRGTSRRRVCALWHGGQWHSASRDQDAGRARRLCAQHFGCDTLDGAEIEDAGGDGTAGSHWEKRVFFNEFMTGSASSDPVFSNLTVAFFEDSGWYKAGADVSELYETSFYWGKGQKCGFAQASCAADDGWPRPDEFPGYFCTEQTQQSCSFDLRGKARCGIVDWSSGDIPTSQRYFGSSSTKGGLSQLADFCPFFSTTTFCRDTTQSGAGGETYGRNSLCFENTLVDSSSFVQKVSGAAGGLSNKFYNCFTAFCTGSVAAPLIKVQINGVVYDCPAGTEIAIDGKTGKLRCPPKAQVAVVCSEGVSIDNDFPEITSIEPKSGPPGTIVTVNGKNFKRGFTGSIDVPVKDTQFVSATQVKMEMQGPDMFKNPLHLTNKMKTVVVTNPDGRSAALVDGFEVQVELGLNVFQNLVDLAVKNPMNTGLICAAIFIGCLCCVYCCCSMKGREKSSSRRDYRGGYYF
jgi:leishmanolysin